MFMHIIVYVLYICATPVVEVFQIFYHCTTET